MKKYLSFLAYSLSGFLASCSAEYHLYRAERKDPSIIPATCAKRYPVKEKDSTSIRYIPGNTVYLPSEPVYVNCDSAAKADPTGSTKTQVPCPPCPYTVDTMLYYKERIQESTAALELKEIEFKRAEKSRDSAIAVISAVEASNKELRKEKRNLIISLSAIGAGVLLFLAFKIFK